MNNEKVKLKYSTDLSSVDKVEYGPNLLFNSRRSPYLSLHGAVASSQMAASQIGLEILKSGGNCIDASVAVAAALGVTEPCSTGLGGDCFALYYDNKTKQVHGMNGSGRAPAALNIDTLPTNSHNGEHINHSSVHAITIPGAAAGWCDIVEKWGTLPMSTILEPAIKLAEEGYPVEPITANSWRLNSHQLTSHPNGKELLQLSGETPKAGEIFKNPNLAATMRDIATKGKNGFYSGRIANAIVELCQSLGGYHNLEDLTNHITTFPDPISTVYRGVTIWEIPPSGQGLTALLALNIISAYTAEHKGSLSTPNSVDTLHLLIESMRLAFADTRHYVADPDHVKVPITALLSQEYAISRAKLINPNKATVDHIQGTPVSTSDTVSFVVVDSSGSACSFINSNYMGFGTGLVPKGCGFPLQNRGCGFSVVKDHLNVVSGNKRPYHTIIPGMATKDGELFGPFSVMGGFMQPQGHVQLLVNSIDFAMEPQRALDMPRFCIETGKAGQFHLTITIIDTGRRGHVLLESDIDVEVCIALSVRGHDVRRVEGWSRQHFGRGQMIRKSDNGVLWAGSDGRGDGQAVGY